MQLRAGYVFGCYTPEGWHVAPRFYGSGESFVFQLEVSGGGKAMQAVGYLARARQGVRLLVASVMELCGLALWLMYEWPPLLSFKWIIKGLTHACAGWPPMCTARRSPTASCGRGARRTT